MKTFFDCFRYPHLIILEVQSASAPSGLRAHCVLTLL
jgi:hypothetical protein